MHGWDTVCNCTRDTLWFQLQAALLHSVSAAAAGGKQILNFGNLEISLGLRGVRRGVCVHAADSKRVVTMDAMTQVRGLAAALVRC